MSDAGSRPGERRSAPRLVVLDFTKSEGNDADTAAELPALSVASAASPWHAGSRTAAGSTSERAARAHAASADYPLTAEPESPGIPRSKLPAGADLCSALGYTLSTDNVLYDAFYRATVESRVAFRLVADVGIVEILRNGDELGFFQINVEQLSAGKWEAIAVREYLRRAAASPLASLVSQFPRQVRHAERRPLSLTPQLRPSAAQLAYLLGLDSSGSLELSACKFPGGVEVTLQNGKKSARLAWSYPHRIILDIQLSKIDSRRSAR